jgi:putative holliday junction resolvase
MPEPRPWVALAFDFGRRRIGLAGCDSITRHPRPIEAVRCTDAGIDWTVIERRVQEWQPTQLVVGMPYNADDTPGALTEAAKAFARELTRRFKLPAAEIDERWSSLEAAERLKMQRHSGLRTHRVRREDIDSTAACIILERWLSQN